MNEPTSKFSLSRSVVGTLIVFGFVGALLFAAGYRDYPNLHIILDTGMFLLSGILALLLWDMGGRINSSFPKHLAVSFAVTALLTFIHVMVTVDWSGPLLPIAQAAGMLRPGTWPPTSHVLPIGIGCSIWLRRRQEQRIGPLLIALLALSAGLLVLYNWLPRYAPPGWLGITRPMLILSPLLWLAVGWQCWRLRTADRILPMLALMSLVLWLANVAMLYSRAPHDTQAMLAHLFRVAGYFILLVSLMQMAALDMRERLRAERELTQSNQHLEQRVLDRTVQLQETNRSLESEMAVRRQVEQANAQLAAIVESSDDAIISKTLEGIITSWNRGAEKLFGYPMKEAVGKSMLMLFPPERVQEEPEIIARISRGEGIEHFETVRVRKDGKQIDVSVTLSPIRDGQGKIIGASKIARDITERKVGEASLQAQLGRLKLLHQITRATGERQDLQSIYQVVIRCLEDDLPIDFSCICIYDQPVHVLKVVRVGVKSGPTAMELAMAEQAVIPIDENGLLRCVRGQLVYEPDIRQVPFPFSQRLARGGLRSLVLAPLLVESRVFGVLVAARRQPQSFVSGECEFLKQLSEHVALASHQSQLYGALRQAYDDLRQSQQAVVQQERLRSLGQMASGVAHDINNAISPVTLYTESLLENEPNLSARARDYLQTIQQAIHDVAETVARMREFCRPREPQMTLAPVHLNRLVQQVIDLTRSRWSNMPQQQGIMIQMQTELSPDLPAFMGIESEIRDALTNLIFNAVDAMPKGGTLTLRTRIGARAPSSEESPALRPVQVEVTDTGVGMDEGTRGRCLEPFFTTRGERGTGLGLAMVYGMVQRHSADIQIESAPGKGTTVRLSFSALVTASAGTVQPSGVHAMRSRLRILVVDDDPLVIKSLRDALETDGHVVVTANGGQAGIDTFRAARNSQEPFAVVLTDLGMPYVDGRKVASEVKAASPSTPVILVTGWGQRLVADGDIPPHVDRVLNKPPKLRDLREALSQCCPPPTGS